MHGKSSAVPHDTPKQKLASLHGYTSDAFAKSGFDTATILADESQDHVLDRNDVEKLFSLTVGTLEKLMAEEKKPQKQEETTAKSTEIEIVDAVGK